MPKTLTEQICIDKFIITSTSDPSVGITESRWELTGPFTFEGPNEVVIFKDKLIEAFNHAAVEVASIVTGKEQVLWMIDDLKMSLEHLEDDIKRVIERSGEPGPERMDSLWELTVQRRMILDRIAKYEQELQKK